MPIRSEQFSPVYAMSATRPLVSVITVVRNSASSIGHAIQSVLEQSYDPIEYIVVDGASTDTTLDVINSFGNRISRVISESDNGIYFAMNKGLRLSTGSMVIFINSDDWLAHPQALSSLVAARQQYGSQPTICYSDFVKRYPTLNTAMLMRADPALERGFSLCHQAMLVDRSAYQLVGEFDTTFRYAADHDWTARAKRAGVHFLKALVPPTVIFNHGGASHSSYLLSRYEAGQVIRREYGRVAHARYSVRQYWVRILRVISDRIGSFLGPESLASLQRFYLRAVRGYRSDNHQSER